LKYQFDFLVLLSMVKTQISPVICKLCNAHCFDIVTM
jgi:hypothetical protein